MTRFPFLVTVLGSLWLASAARATEPLDVVGIKIGMTATQTMAAITAHNPRIQKFWEAGKVDAAEGNKTRAWGSVIVKRFARIPPFIDFLQARDDGPAINITIPTMPDVYNETIMVYFAPGPPDVVHSIHRSVNYKKGREVALSTVRASLTEKYGPPSLPEVFIGTADHQQRWFFGADGKPTPGPPPGCSAPGNMTLASAAVMTASTVGDPAEAVAKCGPTIFTILRIQGANRDLLSTVEVFAIDGRVLLKRARAAHDAAVDYARQQKDKEVGDAAKRGGGKF